MLDEGPRMNSHENPSVRWFYLPKEGKKKTACSRPRFGGAAHLFELNEDKTQPIVLTRLWDRKTVHK